MTDRIDGFTVILKKEMRIDDAESLMQAVGHMENVAKVEPVIQTIDSHIAKSQAIHKVEMELLDFIRDRRVVK